MSSIHSMQLQGIRSFNPKVPERLTFESPVTVLVGQNGSGKTTVIEALKYIATGDMPAGSKGAAFVHDPKIGDLSEVKGQIKLKVSNSNGDNIILTRSLLVTQKKSKTEFKTLEGVVQVNPKRGEQTSMSGKCVDIEQEAILALGVSKPILNNVIFCHQEDSNWPLSEAKVLKSRFDDIFNATMYMKGIESMKLLQKTQLTEISNIKSHLNFYKENKEEAARIKIKLQETLRKVKDGEQLTSELTHKMEPMENMMSDLIERDKEFNALKSELCTKEFQKNSVSDAIKQLQSKITKKYDGSMVDLKFELDNFQSTCHKKKAERSQIEKQARDVECQMANENACKQRNLIEKEKLSMEIETNEAKKEERDVLMKKLINELQMTDYINSGVISDDEATERFFSDVTNSIQLFKANLENLKKECKAKEIEFDSEVQETISCECRLAENLRLKEESLKVNEVELQKISLQLEAIDASREKLGELDENFQRVENISKDVEEKIDESSLKREISDLQSEKCRIGRETNELQTEMFEAQQTGEIRSTLDNLNKEIQMKCQQSENLLEKHKVSYKLHFHGVDQSDLRERVEQNIHKSKSDIRSLDMKLREIQSEMNKNEEARSSCKRQLLKKEFELKEYEEQILKVSVDENNFEGALQRIQKNLEKLRFEKGRNDGSEFLFADYVKRLNKKPCCPLCKRGFSNETEKQSLLTDINRDLNNLPNEKERLNEEIFGEEKKLRRLHQLQPTVEISEKLKALEIPSLLDESEKLVFRYKKLKSEEKSIEDKLGHLKDELASMDSILPDAILVENLQQEIDRFTKKAEELKFNLGNKPSRSMQSIRNDYEDKLSQFKSVTENIESKQETFALHKERVQKLREQLHDLQRQKMDLEKKSRNAVSLQDSSCKLRARLADDHCEVSRLRAETSPAQRRTLVARDNQRRWRQDAEQKAAAANRRLDSATSLWSEVQTFTRQLKDFCNRKIFHKSEELSRQCLTSDEKMKELRQQQEAMKIRWAEMTSELEMQETFKRNLSDNLEVAMKRTEISRLETEIRDSKVAIERLEMAGSGMDATTLREEYTKLTKKFSEAQGRLNEQKLLVKELKKKLEEEKYKTAENLFYEKLIDLHVSKVAVEDLRKFEKALEHCLMAYHREKMDEINRVMRRLWEKIYQGVDIDYIKIKAETAAESGSSDRRRAYNYRVVMVVNSTEVDMRGRCSAGQKMLACIIIRVALADVFCSQCGVLALDEPTTNLDSQNMRSLAEALGELIDERSTQKNFQLILITHDEEFVSILARQHSIDKVCRVFKDRRGFSRLKPDDVSGLLSQLA